MLEILFLSFYCIVSMRVRVYTTGLILEVSIRMSDAYNNIYIRLVVVGCNYE